MSLPKFSNVAQSFHTELKSRINTYFEQAGKSTTGNYKLFAKAIILLISFVALYVHLVFFTPAAVWAILECLLLGGVISTIGFNVMHDGAHGSFSNSKVINTLAAFSLNVLGGSSFMWNMKHNVIHHAYTNVDGIDDDIDAKPFLRLCDTQKFYKMHRYQHLYFWFAYSLLYLYWIFVTDYKKYFTKRVGSVPLKKMTTSDQISFWGFKLFHLFLFVVIPVYFVGFEAWLVGFLISGLFAGLVLSLVFQLAHTVEHTSFPQPDSITGKMEDEWAIHQLKTTSNFATRNRIVSWLVGGLNFQIEHHLFPKISHVHYPAISKIVKQACQEYGIVYLEHRKVYQAVFSHVAFLRQMGR
jgi:linoleoyl-CoA desaturase